MTKPKWLVGRLEKPESTRKKSKVQEDKLALMLKGKVALNSGATFGQNDVLVSYAEVECKTTSKESFSITMKDWNKLVKKCSVTKMPMMALEFQNSKLDLAVIKLSDLKYLIDCVNELNRTKSK